MRVPSASEAMSAPSSPTRSEATKTNKTVAADTGVSLPLSGPCSPEDSSPACGESLSGPLWAPSDPQASIATSREEGQAKKAPPASCDVSVCDDVANVEVVDLSSDRLAVAALLAVSEGLPSGSSRPASGSAARLVSAVEKEAETWLEDRQDGADCSAAVLEDETANGVRRRRKGKKSKHRRKQEASKQRAPPDSTAAAAAAPNATAISNKASVPPAWGAGLIGKPPLISGVATAAAALPLKSPRPHHAAVSLPAIAASPATSKCRSATPPPPRPHLLRDAPTALAAAAQEPSTAKQQQQGGSTALRPRSLSVGRPQAAEGLPSIMPGKGLTTGGMPSSLLAAVATRTLPRAAHQLIGGLTLAASHGLSAVADTRAPVDWLEEQRRTQERLLEYRKAKEEAAQQVRAEGVFHCSRCFPLIDCVAAGRQR